MNLVLTEDQQTLRDTALEFMSREVPIERLRSLRDNERNGRDAELREKLAATGFFGTVIPDQDTGDHFGMAGIGQVLEAQGMQLAATPLLQTAVIGACVIQLAGTSQQQSLWLPKIANGEITFAFAIDEQVHHRPNHCNCKLEASTDGYQLNGSKRYVPNGHHADYLLVVCQSEKGLSYAAVENDTKGLRIEELFTLDSHGAANLEFKNVQVDSALVIGDPGAAEDTLQLVLDRACAAAAAEMLGSAQAAFDMTVSYLKERRQFGQILASFQALQHRLSEIFVDLELTRSLVAGALSAIDHDDQDASELCSMAKASAAELVHRASNECVQLHGGIGMTDDANPGLFIKRARVQESLYGSASYHRNRIATIHGI